MKKDLAILVLISSLLTAGLIFYSSINDGREKPSTTVLVQNYHQAEPLDQAFYDTVYSFVHESFDLDLKTVIGGIAPHHLLAGDMIAKFYANLEATDYDTIVLIGPNHFLSGEAEVISSIYDWQTPFGVLECDQVLLGELEEEYTDFGIEPGVMQAEHAMTSHAGFIKKTFPNARFVPLILHPNIDSNKAAVLAGILARAAEDKKILLIASVDFSHYTDSATAIEQDKNSLAVISQNDFDRVYEMDVDSPPSIYVLMRFAEELQARFQPLGNSNSALLSGKEDISQTTSYITGYFIK